MIKQFRIQNYKALRDVAIDLTPVHVLIGLNDSGKTSILEAIAALCRSVDHPLAQAFTGSWEGQQLVWLGRRELPIVLAASVEHDTALFDYTLSCSCTPSGRSMKVETERVDFASDSSSRELGQKGPEQSRVFRVAFLGHAESDDVKSTAALVYDSLVGVHAYRWDPRFLALPVAPDMKRRFRMEPSGFGLALCLDNILGYDRDLFIRLEGRFREVFPHIKSIKLIPELAFKSPVDDPEQIPMLQKSDGKGIYFDLAAGGNPIPARQVSDGVLLVLAYLTIMHLPQPPRVVLVEEPENGIHPGRLKDVLSILRGLVSEQSQTQIVLTTHSPYVVDLFQPEEVTLCQKEDDGSVSVRRLSESKAVREQLDVFTLGEIWTAEGDEVLAQPAVLEGESLQ
jgi:predicted ATPase